MFRKQNMKNLKYLVGVKKVAYPFYNQKPGLAPIESCKLHGDCSSTGATNIRNAILHSGQYQEEQSATEILPKQALKLDPCLESIVQSFNPWKVEVYKTSK